MFLFAGCDLINPVAGGLNLDKEELSFTFEAGSKTFSITPSEDWEVIVVERWLSVTPDEGFSSESPQTLTVTVEQNNTGEVRTTDITIKAGTICGTVTVTQLQEGAEPDEGGNEGGNGDGNDNTGSNQAVTTIANLKKDFVSTGGNYEIQFTDAVVTYVNGKNVFIEDATGGILFYSENHSLAAGDKLSGLASGQYSIFKNLPQLTSMTGATKTSGATIPCTTLTLSQLLADYDRYVSCRIKIEDVTIATAVSGKDQTTLSQDGSSEKLYVQRSEVSIEAGIGDIIVYPSYYNSRQLGFWEQDDFVKDSTTPDPDPNPDPEPEGGDGTFDSPYTVVQALEIATATASAEVYVKGIVSRTVSINSTYHNIRYYISDDGTTDNELYVYDGKYLNNENFVSLEQVAAGDKVTILGKLKIYNGTKELDRGNYIVEHVPGENNTWDDSGEEADPSYTVQPIVGPSSDWYEIPTTITGSSYWKYITHHTTTVTSNQKVRNFTSCYDTRRKNPMWVASAHHPCYIEGDGRTEPDPWRPDPCLTPEEQSIIYSSDWKNWPWASTSNEPADSYWYWSPTNFTPGRYFTKGHLLRSHDRRGNGKEINIQTFYPTNISPEIHLHPNLWTTVENALTDDWTCSDTTYVVTGNYYDNDQYQAIDASNSGNSSSISKTCIVPAARYRVILRTKTGTTGKSISNCSANELMAIGFWFPQKLDGTAQSDADIKNFIFTVDEIEQKIGGNFNFFPHAPASVMSTVNPSDWGL